MSARGAGSAYQSQGSPRGPFTGSHMLNVRNSRQRSEHDVMLLKNRLERLQQEERKALKKIEETRRRAEQIVHLKMRNEHNHIRKEMSKEYLANQQERARQRILEEKADREGKIAVKREALVAQKTQEADVLRKQRELIDNHLREQKAQHVERARNISEMVKARAAEVQRGKMQQRMQHEEELQMEMERRMFVEEKKRNDADRIVAYLEEEEEVAIERLKSTQDAQKAAYEELERALTQPAPPLLEGLSACLEDEGASGPSEAEQEGAVADALAKLNMMNS